MYSTLFLRRSHWRTDAAAAAERGVGPANVCMPSDARRVLQYYAEAEALAPAKKVIVLRLERVALSSAERAHVHADARWLKGGGRMNSPSVRVGNLLKRTASSSQSYYE